MPRKTFNRALANIALAGITGISSFGLMSQNETKSSAPAYNITTAQVSSASDTSDSNLFKQTNIPTAELAHEYINDDYRSTTVKSLTKDHPAQSR